MKELLTLKLSKKLTVVSKGEIVAIISEDLSVSAKDKKVKSYVEGLIKSEGTFNDSVVSKKEVKEITASRKPKNENELIMFLVDELDEEYQLA